MFYFALFVIAACIIHMLHSFFLKPALSEMIKLDAAKEIKKAKTIQNISQDNQDYLERLIEILKTIIERNDEITLVTYISALVKLEIDDHQKRDESIRHPANICKEVEDVKHNTISFFYSSIANNSLMLVIYLLPICLVIRVIQKITAMAKGGRSESSVIEIFDKHKNNHA